MLAVDPHEADGADHAVIAEPLNGEGGWISRTILANGRAQHAARFAGAGVRLPQHMAADLRIAGIAEHVAVIAHGQGPQPQPRRLYHRQR